MTASDIKPTCPDCMEYGVCKRHSQPPTDPHSDPKTCPECVGTGAHPDRPRQMGKRGLCPTCHGSGKVASEPKDVAPPPEVARTGRIVWDAPEAQADKPHLDFYKQIGRDSSKVDRTEPPTEAVTARQIALQEVLTAIEDMQAAYAESGWTLSKGDILKWLKYELGIGEGRNG